MGNNASAQPPPGVASRPQQRQQGGVPAPRFAAIPDKYASLEEVQTALRVAGLESSNLIVGVDFTKSNEWTGKVSRNGLCLHDTAHGPSPYELAISTIGRTLIAFDDDRMIPAYGFGDASTTDKRVFSFKPGDVACNGFEEVIALYRMYATCVRLSGPTTFGPLIRKAIQVVASTGQYHVLLIIADGQVTRPEGTPVGTFSVQEQDTADAIVQASNYALSIVMVGVGDGPWGAMKEFDDALPTRRFDNFQFVEFNAAVARAPSASVADIRFAVAALQEIPDQYRIAAALCKKQEFRCEPALDPPNTTGGYGNVPVAPPVPSYPPSYGPSPYAAPSASAPDYSSSPAMYPGPAAPQVGSSRYLNAASSGSSYPAPTQAVHGYSAPGTPCPNCTYLNNPDARSCHVCSTLLPTGLLPSEARLASQYSQPAPAPAASYSSRNLAPAPATSYPTSLPRSQSAYGNTYPMAPSYPAHAPVTAPAPVPTPAPAPAPAAPPVDPDANMCCVCMENRKNVAFGCGHLTCSDCAAALRSCPECRAPITTRIKVYL